MATYEVSTNKWKALLRLDGWTIGAWEKTVLKTPKLGAFYYGP